MNIKASKICLITHNGDGKYRLRVENQTMSFVLEMSVLMRKNELLKSIPPFHYRRRSNDL